MILFLDDDHNRINKFRASVPWANIVETAQDMISLLKKCTENKEHIEMLFLDHDLGGEQFVNSDRPDTGMEVVRWIAINKPKIDQIVVHSCNPPAAYRMEDELKDLGYDVLRIPFPSLKLETIK